MMHLFVDLGVLFETLIDRMYKSKVGKNTFYHKVAGVEPNKPNSIARFKKDLRSNEW